MSHIVQIKTQVRDAAAVEAACRRLGLKVPQRRTVKLFSGEASGFTVELPGWQYPVVIDTGSGKISYDNFGGRWGDQKQLDAFLQSYAVEKARLEARRRGHSVTEQKLPDGSVKLTIELSGGAA